MAEQKPWAPRARKRTTGAEDAVPEASGKRPKRASTKAAAEPTPKRKAATVPRRRQGAVLAPDEVAVRAYLLWEQGEPGGADDHWLRAEQELAAA